MNQGVNNQMNQEKNKLKVLVIHGPNRWVKESLKYTVRQPWMKLIPNLKN